MINSVLLYIDLCPASDMLPRLLLLLPIPLPAVLVLLRGLLLQSSLYMLHMNKITVRSFPPIASLPREWLEDC